jgi:hypothetical protein
MSQNNKSKIIGYYDDDGFAYCIKHAIGQAEAIHEPTDHTSFEKCCICGVYLENDLRDTKSNIDN